MSPLAARRTSSSGRWRSARCDDCVVIADETSTANLRWAGNTLTTNGVARSRQLTVIAISRGRGGRQPPAWCPGPGCGDDQIESVVREAEQAAARGLAGRGRAAADRAGRHACAAAGRARLGRPGGGHGDRRVRRPSPPALGEAFGQAAAGGRRAVRLRRARRDLDVPRHLGRAAAAARPADRQGGAQRPRPRTWRGRPGPARRPGTSPTSTCAAMEAEPGHAAGLGEAPGRACRPAGTRRCCRRPRWPT